MKRHTTTYSAIVLAFSWALLGPAPTQAAADNIEPVTWNTSQKSSSWAEELLGQVVTCQTLAEKSLIPGNFEAYVEQMRKVRELYRTGNRRVTYDGVNQLMVMLEARVGASMRTAPTPCGTSAIASPRMNTTHAIAISGQRGPMK